MSSCGEQPGLSAAQPPGAEEPVVHVNLPCSSAAEFRARFAAAVGIHGFVAQVAKPLGSKVCFSVDLADGTHIGGLALVAPYGLAASSGARSLRVLELDSNSLQFPFRSIAEAPAGPIEVKDADIEAAADRPGAAANPSRPPPERSTKLARRRNVPPGVKLPVQVPVPKNSPWSGGLRPLDMVGNYQLLSRLGVGGMAEVYLARAAFGAGMEKLVALKIVLPEFGPQTEFGALFMQEAKLSVTLRHPNLIQVFDYGEADGREFLAMDYVHGRTVAALLRALKRRARPTSPAVGLKIATDLSYVLEYLHDKRDLDGRPLNLVHRDLSANNVLLSERGEVKLVDFGVASASVMDHLGLVVGKPSYICPEQACGGVPEPSWDIFSLGVLLHEMATLKPRLASSDLGAADKHEPFAPINDPAVGPRLSQVIQAATAPREIRVSSARDLRARLEQIRADLHPCDLEQLMKTLFGDELAKEKREMTALASHARHFRPRTVSGSFMLKKGPLSDFRRRVATSRLRLEAARHPRLALAAAALLACGICGVGVAATSSWQSRRTLDRHLVLADARMKARELVGQGSEGALEHLLAARQLRPEDPRVQARLADLARALEAQGEASERAGDLADAAMSFQAALLAEPGQPRLVERCRVLEQRIREQAAAGAKVHP